MGMMLADVHSYGRTYHVDGDWFFISQYLKNELLMIWGLKETFFVQKETLTVEVAKNGTDP